MNGGPVRVDGEPGSPAVVAFQSRLFAWFAQHGRDLPWRRTLDPFAILVSEIMLQQTQVDRVIPKYEAFLTRFPDAGTLAGASLGEVLGAWRGLGYNNRAERLRRAAAEVVRRHGGRLPADEAVLRGLPGIGPYTARALLVFAWNRDVAAVDTNVRRVLTHEFGLAQGVSAAEVQRLADAVVPKGHSRLWHHALMDYGALVLTSRATGIRPPSAQAPFRGSRRWVRGEVVRRLLASSTGALTAAELDKVCEETGVPVSLVVEAVAGLERDGLVSRRAAGGVRWAEGGP